MRRRRSGGALEAEIMAVLWRTDEALTPTAVNALLGEQLAYTTVMTVLARTWKKGFTERFRQGRAFAYRPVRSETEMASERMASALDGVSDRVSALVGFVDALDADDVERLSKALERLREDVR